MSLQIKLGQDPGKPSSVLTIASIKNNGQLNATAFEGKDKVRFHSESTGIARAIFFTVTAHFS
ncbi:MAG: hypothetical protein ACTSYF_09765 [Promethearchaeota archaeon]